MKSVTTKVLANQITNGDSFCDNICKQNGEHIHSLSGRLFGDLTLKTPRKPASENVFCLCFLLNILANYSNLFLHTANSVDPDQTAPRGAV